MLYKIARLLQLLGLVMVPLAIAGNLAEFAGAENQLSLKTSLVLSGIGVGVFYLGWRLQQRAKP